MTRRLVVRARVEPGHETPADRLHDPLVADLVGGGELARARFATLWGDTAGLRALAHSKRAPLPAELHAELAAYHHRLGAPAASMAALERLARGEAVCAVAGQQPAPLGGPLYSLHKIASAVGIAAAIGARTEVPCVPLFWMHGEDSDFAEIRSATIGDAELRIEELTLPDGAHREGGLVGAIPIPPLAGLVDRALGHWQGLPAQQETADLLRRTLTAARDQGEAYSALVLALFGERGLVVVDPRLPAFRTAARPVFERYLAHAEDLGAAARRAGEWLERRLARRPLADAALDSFVFAVEDGARRKLSLAEARAADPDLALSPSVALRPAIQDGVFPTVAMACGASEVGYLAQLREVFDGLGVRPACAVPRLGATWLPRAAVEMMEASGVGAWELITGADQVLRSIAERAVPPDVGGELERARGQTMAALEAVARSARRVDPSLPQMFESARGKVDYQYARLLEGLTGKMRHRIERQHPEWARLRYYLLPGDRLQERKLASLEPVAHRGATVAADLCDLAAEQARRLERGTHDHLVLDL